MIEIIRREAGNTDLRKIVGKLISGSIGKDIEAGCESLYPLHNVFIRKVKTLRSPKLDVTKLLDMHGGAAGGETEEDVGMTVDDGEAVKELGSDDAWE